MKSVPIGRPLAAFTLLCASPWALAQQDLIPKQLAGEPSEFASMRAPDPAAGAIHSKSALLPITFAPDKAGELSWETQLPVENGRLRFLVFADGNGHAPIALAAPSGRSEKAAALALAKRRTEFGMEQTRYPADMYTLDGVENGRWSLKVRATERSQGGYLLLEGDPATELASHLTHTRQLAGERIGLNARLTATGAHQQVLLGTEAGRIERAVLDVTHPDGRVETLAMADDGRHDDGAAGDGVFGGAFFADLPGTYLAQVRVEGSNRHGQPLLRSAEHAIPVVEADLTLEGALRAIGHKQADGRLGIAVPVRTAKSGRHYRAYAELWGHDAEGNELPVAWLGGMVTPKAGNLEMALDRRWLDRAGALGPFELRGLRIEDPNHFVTVAGADRLPLELPVAGLRGKAVPFAIDASMQMGPRPAALDAHKATGSRLLLVHGYCSGDVWPASHFSSASKFLDLAQNRSHDQFARLIRDFGAQWNSFGVVAHSQGGAASLHLYTYYWSGLDRAGSGRLIQSVGTPYQGTNLAGILAALGSWFGVGCGTNDNLSYSGAASWLAGIPSWARAKVNYYTTSFATAWWRYDYCNMATDVVLSDPEDGTTERAYGQLPGASNRGHTLGQCHTTNMRDPAQYLDGNRNAVMNSNAAR